MLISQYQSLTGKEKAIANEDEGAGRTRKRCTFKDSVSYVPGLTEISAKKQPKKTTWFFVGDPPPLTHRGLTWFYKEPSFPPRRTKWVVFLSLITIKMIILG